MKELIKPIDSENQYEKLFAEAMCSENNCGSCGCSGGWGGAYNSNGANNDLGEEDDILF